MKTLARETGAQSFFPAPADLKGVYGSIATELANQYSIGYMPGERPAGRTLPPRDRADREPRPGCARGPAPATPPTASATAHRRRNRTCHDSDSAAAAAGIALTSRGDRPCARRRRGSCWVAAILLAPLAIASGRATLSLGAAGVYAAGARVCHQRPERCFWIHGGRCRFARGARGSTPAPRSRARWPCSSRPESRAAARASSLSLAALPTLITWGLEFAGLAHPSNSVRAIAALPLGFVVAWLVISYD